MISFVSLLLSLGSAGAVPIDTLPPPAVVSEATALVASTWDTDPESLVLDWGRLPSLPDSLTNASFRLGGSGRNGWFVLTITPNDGRPVAITLRAGIPQRLPVATTALTVGRQITDADRTWEERVAWGAPSASTSVDPVGWDVRRPIAAGDVLAAPVVRAPLLISAGDPVTFVWTQGRVRMERIAPAQAAARAGDLVRAQVGEARLVGRVVAPGVAIVEETP